jgi:hypothetical protein
VLLIVVLLGFSLPYHPYYLAYFNPLLGGPWLAPHLVKVGWGEGMERTAAWLNARPDANALTVATSYAENFLPFFVGQATKHHGTLSADYVLNYIRQIQNGYPYPEYWEYYKVREPVYRLRIAGIDYVWLYHEPSLVRVRDIGFGEGLTLMGYVVKSNASAGSGALAVTLVWRATGTPTGDVRLQLRDESGRVWGESEPAPVIDPNGPSSVEGHCVLRLPTDMPPGEYQLWATVGAENMWTMIGTIGR